MQILQKQNETKGSFYVENNGEMVAELTYSMAPNNIMILDHTEVATSLRGMNVGYQLVSTAVNFARENKMKIIPLCPYAKVVFAKKQDEWKDVLRN